MQDCNSPELEKGLDPKFGSSINNPPSVFTFQDITFTVANNRQILKGIGGYAKAGDFVALMGSSGCGKTTLLNILASRIGGARVSGSITLDGKVPSASLFRRVSTFVEQEDSLIGSLSVLESVDYAARLSLSSISASERRSRVSQILHAFGIYEARNVKIGTPLQKGCSGGQKRRVSIASQVITLPQLVFLDEPTSGLDSAASFEVCSKLKAIAQENNMIIVASIHQPSTSTFKLFSNVLLLSKGYQLYFGPTEGMAKYFRDRTEYPVPADYNPADHVLDVSNVDFYEDANEGMAHIEKLAAVWQQSPEQTQLSSSLSKESLAQVPGHSESHTKPTSQLIRHVGILLHRSVRKAIRDPLAYGVRLVMYLGLAIMMGTVWLRLSSSQNSIKAFITALFFGSAFMSFMAVAYIPAYLEDYASYKKERRNGLYGPLAFILANTIISIPFLYIITISFSIVTYFMINFRHSATGFFNYTLWLFLDLLAAESLVVLISTLAPIFVAALALTAFANGLWMSVGGFLVTQDVLNVFWYYTFYQIDYQRYVFDGLMRNEFLFRTYNCASGCNCLYPSALSSQCQIAGEAILNEYGLNGNFNPGVYVAILLAITIFMRLATYVILTIRK